MRCPREVLARGRAAALTAALVLLTACETAPTRLPDRDDASPTGVDDSRRETREAMTTVTAFRPSPYRDLFQPAEKALDAGDWMSASLALPQGGQQDDDEFRAYRELIEARIARQRGNLTPLRALLADRNTDELSGELALGILGLVHEQAALEGQHLRAAELSLAMLQRLPADHARRPDIESATWAQLRRVPASERPRAAEGVRDERAGWLAAAAGISPGAFARQFPEHPAQRFVGAPAAAAPQRVALLLPLGGRLGDAAAAVRDGFLREYFRYQSSGTVPWDVIVVDSSQHDSPMDAYRAAVDNGAQLVVGPLTKSAVGSMLSADTLPVPLLALNRGSDALPSPDDSLQFALAPEDEARQLARLAYADGHRRILLVRPAGEWGDKMESALQESWTQLGGSVADRAVFSSRETQSASLAEGLGLTASNRRAGELRRLLAPAVEFTGRRRDDIDAVVLLVPSTEDARSLRPLLAFHYAGGLPVYAGSAANSAEIRGEERDLRDLVILEMPHILKLAAGDGTEATPGLRSDPYQRLQALGIDAFRLSLAGIRGREGGEPLLQGVSGFLSLNVLRQVERELVPAVFDRGGLHAR
jgi:outer membrane PBP1 activator LpoA protein